MPPARERACQNLNPRARIDDENGGRSAPAPAKPFREDTLMNPSSRIVIGTIDTARGTEIRTALRSAGFDAVLYDSGQDVLDRCREAPPAAVVVDADLPRQDGLDVLKSLKREGATAGVRVLVLLGDEHPQTAQRARLLGADAVLGPPLRADSVAAGVKAALAEGHSPAAGGETAGGGNSAIEALLRSLDAPPPGENPLLRHITDARTGLFNRAYMDLKLAEEFKKARRFSIPLSVMVLGIEDDGGGDGSLLNEIAGILLCESRDIDHAGRHDLEFLLLLPHTDALGASTMGARILAAIERRDLGRGRGVRASIGIASMEHPAADSADTLVQRARDARSASASRAGKPVTVWTPGLEIAPS